jgi:hypothetical protein
MPLAFPARIWRARQDRRRRSLRGGPVNVGVPHLVVFVPGVLPSFDRAPARRCAGHPAMPGANQLRPKSPGPRTSRARDSGRRGETLACGSGVVASAIVRPGCVGAGCLRDAGSAASPWTSRARRPDRGRRLTGDTGPNLLRGRVDGGLGGGLGTGG